MGLPLTRWPAFTNEGEDVPDLGVRQRSAKRGHPALERGGSKFLRDLLPTFLGIVKELFVGVMPGVPVLVVGRSGVDTVFVWGLPVWGTLKPDPMTRCTMQCIKVLAVRQVAAFQLMPRQSGRRGKTKADRKADPHPARPGSHIECPAR